MGFKSSTFRILIALMLFSASALVNNAQGQSHLQLDRLSLTVNGGINFADLNSPYKVPFMQSNLSTLTEQTITYGAGLQYKLIPALSLEAGYKYSNIRGESGNFETTMNTVSLKSIVSLNWVINPYLSAGVGYDLYSFSSPSNTFNENSISYNAGVGLAIKVTNNIDLFSHYEYHLASNSIDDINTGLEYDILTTLTGGLRINFSSNNKKTSIGSSRQSRPVEVSPSEDAFPSDETTSSDEFASSDETTPSDEAITSDETETTPADYSDLASITEKIEYLEQDVNYLEQRIEEQEQRYMENPAGDAQATDRLIQRVEDMEILLQEVRSKLNDIPDKPVVENSSGIAESIPPGSYVQIFATERLSSAQEVRNDAISHLESQLDDTSEQVFITRRDKFYQVLIGEFSDKAKASNIKSTIANQYSDAFIIVFPRPMSLQSAYNGIQIVE